MTLAPRIRWLRAELRQTLDRPARILGLFSWRRLRRFSLRLWRTLSPLHTRARWQPAGDLGLHVRQYRSYEDYVRHQRSKLETLNLETYEERLRHHLGQRLLEDDLDPAGRSALCLGARLGAEVRAFRDLGCFAVGVDLNPGQDNPYVLQGDFHQLAFPDGAADLIYSNALDHALDVNRVLAEARRVLKSDGKLILEVGEGLDSAPGYGDYESLAWSSLEDLLGVLEGHGFRVARRVAFSYPWSGWHLLLETSESDGP